MYPNHGNFEDDDDEDLPQIINNPNSGNARAGSSIVGAGRGRTGAANAPPMGGYGGYAGYGAPGGFGGMGAMAGPGFGRGRGAGGPGGLLGGLMGFGGGGGYATGGYGGGYGAEMEAPPGAYDEYFKAYSVAIMDGPARDALSYGGKICMPPSTLARLTNINCPSPFTFQLFNPKDPKSLHTHAGVLEFIAQEGCCYLPRWMMKHLKLNEGDPIRLKNVDLPTGTFVKLQAQSVDFLQVTDPKAVLEAAFRNFSTVSKGDIIEIVYNSITFEFLIVETKPQAPGIMLIDTDLTTDFDTPVGYVEPEKPKPIPIATMADKLKIDLNSTVPATRPPSAMSGRAGSSIAGSLDNGSELEAFKGIGNTLEGRKTKGKGKARKIGEVDPHSKIVRTDKPRMMTNERLTDGKLVPAALNLPKGKLFFGFTYKPFNPDLKVVKPEPEDGAGAKAKPSFVGAGAALDGRTRSNAQASSSSKEASTSTDPAVISSVKVEPPADPWAKLSGGNKLQSASGVANGSTAGFTAQNATADQGSSTVGSAALAADEDEDGEDEHGYGDGDGSIVDVDEYDEHDENDAYWPDEDAIVIDSD